MDLAHTQPKLLTLNMPGVGKFKLRKTHLKFMVIKRMIMYVVIRKLTVLLPLNQNR